MEDIYKKHGKRLSDHKLANKLENINKDTKIKQQEKVWDKTVDDLNDDDKLPVASPDIKGDIKLNFAGKRDKDVKVEKGFGKFTWVKQEDKEQVKETQNEQEKTDKHDEKKGIAINITGKTIPVRSTGIMYGKKNPLLPPWQPVGKKPDVSNFPMRKEVKTEKESPSGLDMFLTSNKDGGKIPVIGENPEKKKISAKEILEAFSGKYKDKDIQPKSKTADSNNGTKIERKDKHCESKERKSSAENFNLEDVPLPEQKKSKKEIQEEKDMKMMGIDPSSSKLPTTVKPPPPISQNMKLPNEKSATITSEQIHDVYYKDVNLDKIPLPQNPSSLSKQPSIGDKVSESNDKPKTEMKQAKAEPVAADSKASVTEASNEPDLKSKTSQVKHDKDSVKAKTTDSLSNPVSEPGLDIKAASKTDEVKESSEKKEVPESKTTNSKPDDNMASANQRRPRGRGRGAARGAGRGRGAKTVKTTRTTRSMTAVEGTKSPNDNETAASIEKDMPESKRKRQTSVSAREKAKTSPEKKSSPVSGGKISTTSGHDKTAESGSEG